MITLDANQALEVERPVTRPQYLLRVDLSSPVLLSSRKEVDLTAGLLFQSGKLRINSLSSQRCSFELCNQDYQYTQGAMNGDYLRGKVIVWWAYGGVPERWYPDGYETGYEAEPTATTPLLIFEGEISAINGIGEWLTLEATRESVSRYPKRKILPPYARHTTPAGTVLKFAGQTYRIESR